MLAGDAEDDSRCPRDVDHFGADGDVDRHRFLHLNVLAVLSGQTDRLQTEIGESADIDEIDIVDGGRCLLRSRPQHRRTYRRMNCALAGLMSVHAATRNPMLLYAWACLWEIAPVPTIPAFIE